MTTGIYRVPTPQNEPILSYAPGTPERASLSAQVERTYGEVAEIPCVIGGKHIFTGNTVDITLPCEHSKVIARVHLAGPEEVNAAIQAAESARREWAALPWQERAAIFLRAASLLQGPWRDRMNAATMLGQA